MLRLVLASAILLVGCKDKKSAPPSEPKVTPVSGSGSAGSGSGSAVDPDLASKCLDNPLMKGCDALPKDALLAETQRREQPANWPEQKGEGFVVRAPGKPRTETKTGNYDAGGTFEATFYLGFGMEPTNQTLQVAFYDSKQTDLPPAEIVSTMLEGYLAMCDKPTIAKTEVTVGDVKGPELQCKGSHPQLGPYRLRARFLFQNKRLWVVQSLVGEKSKIFAGDPFVESFRFAP